MMSSNDAISLAGVSRVVSLSLSRDGEGLSIVLRMREEESRTEIGYEFSNVSNVKFRGERTELNELVLIMSEDISSNGWEGVRFRIGDYEEEFLSFLCGDMRRLG
jgi:hypothetical protein